MRKEDSSAPLTGMDVFETPRLIGERLRPEHFDEVLAMHADPVEMRYLGGVRSAEATAGYFERNLRHWDQYGFGVWILRDRTAPDAIGRAVLRHLEVDGIDEIELGYGLAPGCWGRGLGTEIARQCILLGRARLNRDSLVAVTHHDNTASQRVLVKAGLSFDRSVTMDGDSLALFRVRFALANAPDGK